MGDVEDHRLRELRSCQHFLVDFELERARQSIQLRSGNSQRNNRERETWSSLQLFEMCRRSESVNLAFVFILENIEDGGFRYFYAHEDNTLLDRSGLVSTHEDLAKLKYNLNETDVIEWCSRWRMNTKWRFYKLTNLTVVRVWAEVVGGGGWGPSMY